MQTYLVDIEVTGRNLYKILLRKPLGKRKIVRPRRRCKHDNNMKFSIFWDMTSCSPLKDPQKIELFAITAVRTSNPT
jgi:hypothetical protein